MSQRKAALPSKLFPELFLFLGAQPAQGNHMILLLTAALAAVSLPPKCLITVNAPLPVPTATS